MVWDTQESLDVQCGGHVDDMGWDLLGSGLRPGVVPIPPKGVGGLQVKPSCEVGSTHRTP